VRIISAIFVDAGTRAVGTSGGEGECPCPERPCFQTRDWLGRDSRTRVYGRIEDAMDKWEICAVTGKVDRVKDERAEMAIDLSVNSLDDNHKVILSPDNRWELIPM
jgi:hypothetical protein